MALTLLPLMLDRTQRAGAISLGLATATTSLKPRKAAPGSGTGTTRPRPIGGLTEGSATLCSRGRPSGITFSYEMTEYNHSIVATPLPALLSTSPRRALCTRQTFTPKQSHRVLPVKYPPFKLTNQSAIA